MIIKSLKKVFATILLAGFAMTAFAEDAPVYDVDNYPPPFDGQPDSASAEAPAPAAPPAQILPQSSSQNMTQQPLPMDQRMSRVEQQMTNMQHSDAASRMNALQNEVQSLRGQVEELTHQLQQVQTQQRSMFSDLDKRITKQSTLASQSSSAVANTDETAPKKTVSKKPKNILTPAPIPAADEPADEDQPVAAPKLAASSSKSDAKSTTAVAGKTDPVSPAAEQEELQMYQNAYDLIKDSKFDQAIAVLQNMLKKYPSGQSAANAHYWLGELYGLQKKRDQSAVEFATVARDYPDSPKVSDAEVKLGMIYAAQFKWPEAKSSFKRVMSRYPGTTSARLAAQQLKEIKAGGH